MMALGSLYNSYNQSNGLMDWMGMGNAQNAMNDMDRSGWDYNAAQSNYGGPNSYLTGAMGNLNNQAGALNQTASQFGSRANEMFGHGQQFIDPNSEYYQKQRGFLREDVTGATADASRQMNQMMASRGVGSGGIRGALEATNASQIGEQVRRGSNDLYQQGVGQASSLFGLGMQGLQGQSGAQAQAGGLYGQVGQLGAGIDANALQQSMFNTGQTNQSNQFNAQGNRDWSTMQYNQAAAQDANVAGLWGGAMSLGTTAAFASDIRVKENIEYLNTSPDGHKVYSFNYKGSDNNRYKGVMAQDVLGINSDAVKSIDGILHVDYSRLDVDMEAL